MTESTCEYCSRFMLGSAHSWPLDDLNVRGCAGNGLVLVQGASPRGQSHHHLLSNAVRRDLCTSIMQASTHPLSHSASDSERSERPISIRYLHGCKVGIVRRYFPCILEQHAKER